MSPWNCIQGGLLILAIILGLYLASSFLRQGPVAVPEEQMMADWRELERLAREHPYNRHCDHGQR